MDSLGLQCWLLKKVGLVKLVERVLLMAEVSGVTHCPELYCVSFILLYSQLCP